MPRRPRLGRRPLRPGGRTTLVVFGTLPPPATGQSLCAEAVCDLAARSGFAVKRLRVEFTAHGIVDRVRIAPFALSYLWALTRLVCLLIGERLRRRRMVVYVTSRANRGRVLDVAPLAMARWLGDGALLHHDTMGHVQRPTRTSRLNARLAAVNVVLCDRMADDLRAVIPLPADRVVVVSNAFSTPRSGAPPTPRSPTPDGVVVLGMIANLSAAKGVAHAVDLVGALNSAGVQARLVLAGPIGDDEVRRLLSEPTPNVHHLGPVYGDAKARFFESIDWLVLPSADEAEPLVVFEAASTGRPTLATPVGCLAGQVGASGMTVALPWDRGSDSFRSICEAIGDPPDWRTVQRRFEAHHDQATASLLALLRSRHAK